ncbi:MAG TPA: T9SS type A sorting domain-containing protein [Cryomorphaceae bacterium]|nr:T9SS type A sorting domain-containing protein [Cryomorphaceae bacterium]
MRFLKASFVFLLSVISFLPEVFSQSVEILNINAATDPVVIRVAGVAEWGYIDRITEIEASAYNDTARIEIFLDWCSLPGGGMTYDTTFAIQSTFPFNLCVTAYTDTLDISSPCESWNATIDTGETVCLSADQILSAESFAENQEVFVYPNPTTERLNIDLSALKKIPSSYIIRDLSGRLLKEGVLNEIVETVDVSALPSGILILEMQFESGVLRQRFVKIR